MFSLIALSETIFTFSQDEPSVIERVASSAPIIVIPKEVTGFETSFQKLNSTLCSIIFNGSNVKHLCDSMFYNCRLLNKINIEVCTSLTEIPDKCFQGCSRIRSITLPPNIRHIKSFAFYGCILLSSLTYMNIEAIVNIQTFAFGITSLTNFTIPPKVNILMPTSFRSSHISHFDTTMQYFVKMDNVSLFLKKMPSHLVIYPPGRKELKYEIPNGTTQINSEAFAYHLQLKEIVFNKELTKIFYNAFSGTKIKEVEIPNSVKLLDIGAFSSSGLTKVVILGKLTEIKKQCFANNYFLNTLVLPQSIKHIEKDAFSGTPSLRNIFTSEDVAQQLIDIGFPKSCIHLSNLLRVHIRIIDKTE